MENLKYMFYGALSLSSIDLSSFDTNNVINMENMFHGCKALTELNLNNFDTSKVTDMVGIFAAFMTYELSYSNFKFIFEGGVDCVHCTLLFKLNNSWVALKAEYVLESETCEDGVKFLAMSMVDYIENIKWGLWKLSKEEEINCTMTLRPGYDGTIFTFPLMWLNVERLTRY